MQQHAWHDLSQWTGQLTRQLRGSPPPWQRELEALFHQRLGGEVDFADSWSQAMVCGQLAVAVGDRMGLPSSLDILTRQADPITSRAMIEIGNMPRDRRVEDAAELLLQHHQTESKGNDSDPLLDSYEWYLRHHDRHRRRHRGVYYTPRPLVQYLLRRSDHVLRQYCRVADGLSQPHAHHRPLRILDPAAGSGAFLVEAIRHVVSAAAEDTQHQRRAVQQLLPRLAGVEIMLPAVVVGQLRLAATVADYGIALDHPPLQLADTLTERPDGDEEAMFPVVVGNPPFRALSSNRQRWIQDLLHGNGNTDASYFHCDGRPLKERKAWLHDDYVKFLRYAHWCVERSGWGVIALVVNHGMLENATFRGLRQSLLRTFCCVEIVDLHGNRKAKEVCPDGRRDENVFGIDQGVALLVLAKAPPALERSRLQQVASVHHGELWGSAADKLNRIHATSNEAMQKVLPRTPYYLLVPRDERSEIDFQQGCPLPELMPVSTSVPVTARDRLVIAFNRDELLARMTMLADLSIPDQVIRERFFRRHRASQYPSGDTRSWRLSEARRQLAEHSDLSCFVRRCQYRALDQRFIFWADWMIDWPRRDVSSLLELPDNLMLITRRQMLSGQPCNFFWVSDQLPLDGILRSDNRGNESMFPLWSDSAGAAGSNFDDSWLPGINDRLFFPQFSTPRGRQASTRLQALTVFQYLFALFQSRLYQTHFAEQLRREFPRAFLPKHPDLFQTLSELGADLINACCLRVDPQLGPTYQGSPDMQCKRPFPRWQEQRLWLAQDAFLEPVPEAVWMLRIGAHQVCQKWLTDRRGRKLGPDDIHEFRTVVTACQLLLDSRRRIDRVFSDGGWNVWF